MLFSGVRLHSYSLVEDSILLPSVQVGHRCVLKKCIIDRDCNLPDDTRIGFDPVKDSLRFHVTDSGLTLVTRVMLGQDVDGIR